MQAIIAQYSNWRRRLIVGVWSYFGITEQLNRHSTELKLMSSDLEKNTEFRIKCRE